MRVLVCVLASFVLLVPAAGATPPGLKVLARDGSELSLLYLGQVQPFTQPLTPKSGRLGFSGDGRLISIGHTILGRATLPGDVVWGPSGERAAAVTPKGGVVVWTPAGRRVAVPKGWGAQTVAWSKDGALAIGRFICPHGKCAYGKDKEIWVWRDGALKLAVGPFSVTSTYSYSEDIPMPFAWSGSHILWWQWPGSGSIAADGVALFEDGRKLGSMLMYPDWVATCGTHLAFASGGDRYSTDAKKIVFDGRVLATPRTLSWASPSCTADGRLVASASRNVVPRLTSETHRALWQLLPVHRQLTRPPWGWSDEDPRLFPDGGVLFVRSRTTSKKRPTGWVDTQTGRVMLLSHGKVRQVAQIGFTQPADVYTYPVQYYGHYDWSQLLAVAP